MILGFRDQKYLCGSSISISREQNTKKKETFNLPWNSTAAQIPQLRERTCQDISISKRQLLRRPHWALNFQT